MRERGAKPPTEVPGVSEDEDRLERAYEAERAVIRQALDLPGPWPASTTSRTQNVEVLDVDRYDGFGVVLAAIERPVLWHGPTLQASVFRSDNGWQPLCGGGGGGSNEDPLMRRRRWTDATSVILRGGGGRCRPGPHQRAQTVCYAKVICSPSVASVVVDRPSDRRFVDVMNGPGWVVIVWPEGAEPRVTALGSTGEELDYLDPGLFRDR
jgi:hypothetical protein